MPEEPTWKTRAKTALWHYIPVVLVGLAALLYLRFARAPIPTYQSAPQPVTTATEPKSVAKVERVIVPGPERIVYLDRARVEGQLKWSPSIPDNVLAVAEIPEWRGKTTAIATARTVDNVLSATVIYRQEPPKFFDLKREISLYAGYGSWGGVEAGATLRPLRIGPVDTFGTGRVRTERDGAVKAEGMLGVEYRF